MLMSLSAYNLSSIMKKERSFRLQLAGRLPHFRPASLLDGLRLLPLLLPLSAPGATYHVSLSGSDSNPGTESQPWRTWQKAFNTMQPGDTTIVAAGDWSDGEVSTARNGSSGSPIILQGASGARLTGGKLIVQHAWHEIRGIEFRRQLTLYGNGANNVVVRSNWFTSHSNFHLYCDRLELPQPDGPNNNLIAWNVFSNALNHFVNINGWNNRVASNFFTINNGWDLIRCSGSNQVIVANTFTNIWNDPNNNNHADIIQTFDNAARDRISRDVLFERNVIADSQAQWMNLEGSANSYDRIKDWTFRNNLLIRARGQANIYIPGVRFYNNTVWRSPYPILVRFTGSPEDGYAHNGVVVNNLFIESGTHSGNGYYSLGSGAGLTNMTANYNGVTDANSQPKTGFNEPNGINGFDPKFENPDGGDFRLRPDSPAVNAGTTVSGFAEDIVLRDRTRKLTFDLGAFMHLDGSAPERPAGLRVVGR